VTEKFIAILIVLLLKSQSHFLLFLGTPEHFGNQSYAKFVTAELNWDNLLEKGA
jgi:hypothetical protein